MTVSNEVIDSLLADYKNPEDLIDEHGILKQLTKRLVERALEVELAEHLDHGGMNRLPIRLATPVTVKARRPSRGLPQVIPKQQTRWNGFDDKILSLYARGMTVREIQKRRIELIC